MGERKEYIHVRPTAKNGENSTLLGASAPTTSETARSLVVRALEDGVIHVTAHFKEQAAKRRFDVLDCENVLRDGSLRGKPEYCPDYNNWKYRFCHTVENEKLEDKTLEVVVSLDPTQDYDHPLVIYITGYWRD